MSADRLRALAARLTAPDCRRPDLAVTAYCHAFDVDPGAIPDGGRTPDED